MQLSRYTWRDVATLLLAPATLAGACTLNIGGQIGEATGEGTQGGIGGTSKIEGATPASSSCASGTGGNESDAGKVAGRECPMLEESPEDEDLNDKEPVKSVAEDTLIRGYFSDPEDTDQYSVKVKESTVVRAEVFDGEGRCATLKTKLTLFQDQEDYLHNDNSSSPTRCPAVVGYLPTGDYTVSLVQSGDKRKEIPYFLMVRYYKNSGETETDAIKNLNGPHLFATGNLLDSTLNKNGVFDEFSFNQSVPHDSVIRADVIPPDVTQECGSKERRIEVSTDSSYESSCQVTGPCPTIFFQETQQSSTKHHIKVWNLSTAFTYRLALSVRPRDWYSSELCP